MRSIFKNSKRFLRSIISCLCIASLLIFSYRYKLLFNSDSTFELFHNSKLIHDDQFINYSSAKGIFSPRNKFLYVFCFAGKTCYYIITPTNTCIFLEAYCDGHINSIHFVTNQSEILPFQKN